MVDAKEIMERVRGSDRSNNDRNSLLEEYLRTINKKDQQLHELLRVAEEHRSNCEEKEVILKGKIKTLDGKLRRKKDEVERLKQKVGKDAVKVQQLSLLVDSLKNKLNGDKAELEEAQRRVGSLCDRVKVVENSLKEKEEIIKTLQEEPKKRISKRGSSSEIVETEDTHPFNVLGSSGPVSPPLSYTHLLEKMRLQQILVNRLQHELRVLQPSSVPCSDSGSPSFRGDMGGATNHDAGMRPVESEMVGGSKTLNTTSKEQFNEYNLETDLFKEAAPHQEVVEKKNVFLNQLEELKLKNDEISIRCSVLESEKTKLQMEVHETRSGAIASENDYQQKLADAQSACEEMQKKVAALSERQHTSETQAHIRESELIKQIDKLKMGHFMSFEEVRARALVEKDELQNRLQLYREKLAAQTAQFEGTLRSLSELDKKRQRERSQMEEELMMLRVVKGERDSLQLTVTDLQAKLSEKNVLIEGMLKEVSEARCRVEETRKIAETAERCQKKERECETEVYQRQLEVLNGSLKVKEDNLRCVEQRLRLDLLEKERVILQLEFTKQKLELNSDAVSKQLKNEIDLAVLRETKLNEEIEKLRKEKSLCDTSIQQLESKIIHLEMDRTTLQQQCSAITCRAVEVEKVASQTVDDLLRVRKEALEKIQSSSSNFLTMSEGKHVKPTTDTWRAPINSVEDREPHARNKPHVAPSTTLDDNKFSELREGLEAAERRHREAETMYNELYSLLQNEKKEHENTLRQSNLRIEELEEALSTKVTKYKAVKRNLRETQEQLNDCEKHLQEVEKQRLIQISETEELHKKYRREKEVTDRQIEEYEIKIALLKNEERESRTKEASLISELEKCESALREKEIVLHSRSTEFHNHLLNVCRSPPLADVPDSSTTPVSKPPQEEKVLKSLYDQVFHELESTRRRVHAIEYSNQKLMNHARCSYIETVFLAKGFISEMMMQSVIAGWRDCRRLCHNLMEGAAAEKEINEEKLSLMLKQHEDEKRFYAKKCEDMVQSIEDECKRKLTLTTERTNSDIRQGRQDLLERIAFSVAEKEKLESLLDERNMAYQSLAAKNERLNTDINFFREQVETLRSRLVEEESRCATLIREREAKCRESSSETQTLRTQLEETGLECRHAEEEIRSLKSELSGAKQALVEKEVQVQREKQRVKVLNEKIDSISSELKEAKNDIVTLSSHLRTVSAELANEKDASQRYAIQLSESELRWETKLCDLEAKVSSHFAEKKKFERLTEQHQREIEGLRNEVIDLHKALEDGQEALEAKGSELSLLRERCANVESLKHILQNSLQVSQERECRLRGQLDDMRRSHQIMQVCFDKQQNQINSRSVGNNAEEPSTVHTADATDVGLKEEI